MAYIKQAEETPWEPGRTPNRQLRRLINADDTPLLHTVLVQLGPGEAVSLHSHSVLETMYILEGEGHGQVAGERGPCRPGTIMYAPAGVEHELKNTGQGNMVVLCTFCPPNM
ncbi:MAG: cupin domain-containing protein [Chloroflexi bacterium]|nr:cupin domain-containing protein [Chloroflexota bacterium]